MQPPILDDAWMEARQRERRREAERRSWALYGGRFSFGRVESPRERVADLYAKGYLTTDELERYMEEAVRA